MSNKKFSADVEQLIQLVTHSIYSNKDIFLREIISNANDAIQKAKLKSIENADYLGDNHDLKIELYLNKEEKIITIKDNGIGMTTQEVEKNIGTIAKSGTKEFLEKLKSENKSKNNNLIGQFGIGFYSVFMIADKVELETKSNEQETGTKWISEGKGTYEIDKSTKTDRGTEIKLFIKNDCEEFLEESKIQHLIEKHSNYIPIPIMFGDKQINKIKSIWTKNKSEVTKEEYKDFYQSLSFDNTDPIDTIHLDVEGKINYKAIFFIPKNKNPFQNMLNPENDFGPSLYVKNVLILNNCKELIPQWLRFTKGILETDDLSLNVSREILQNNTIIEKIKSSLTKEFIKSISYIKNNKFDEYVEFFDNFGQFIKEGAHSDFINKEKISELLIFNSLIEGKKISLDNYINNIKNTEDKNIYYMIGKSIQELSSSPFLEQFRENGVDVLLMDNTIDERVINSIDQYKEYKFKSSTSQDIQIDKKEKNEEKKQQTNKQEADNKDFISTIISTLGNDKLEKVTFGHKNENIVGLFLSEEGKPSIQMEKIMKAMGQEMPKIKRTLEININSPLVKKAIELYKNSPTDEKIVEYIKYFYEQAIIIDGGELENTNDFIKRINNLLL